MPAFLPSTQTSISTTSETVTRWILRLTLYDMMQASGDFEDVKAALDYRTDRSIKLFRSCCNIHLSNGNYYFMSITLFFLAVAESIHLGYGRLSPAELKEFAERIGYMTFALLFALLFAALDVGFVIVRVVGFVALSGSPVLAASLVLISMSPLAIFAMLVHPVRLPNLRRKSGGEGEMELGTVVDGG